MAQKEIAIKIKIDGKDITVADKQLESLTSTISELRTEMNQMGERTEQNAQAFDSLKGNIETLESVYQSLKDEVKETGTEQGKAETKTVSYAAQIKKLRLELISLGERTSDNGKRYDELTTRIQDLSEKQEDLQFGTKKLDDALTGLPGPIGQAAQGFKGLDDNLKNAKSAFSTLTKQFPILKSAIAATGIGAIVIIIGLLVGAVIKAAQTFKPLQDAVGKAGALFETFMDAIKPVTEFILNVTVVAMEKVARAIAWVTGNLDEYNKKLADKKAQEDFVNNLKQQEEWLDANSDKYDEYTQRKLKANLEYNKKVKEINEDETKSEQEKNALIVQFREKANREIDRSDNDRQKAAQENIKREQERSKQSQEQKLQLENDFQKRLTGIKNENALLEIQDEKKRGELKLKQEYDNQIQEINQLKVSETKKQQLREQTLTNYQLKQKEQNEAYSKDLLNAELEFNKKLLAVKVQGIEDETDRGIKQRELQLQNDLSDLEKDKEFIRRSEQEKADIRKLYTENAEKDIAKIRKDAGEKARNEAIKSMQDSLNVLEVQQRGMIEGTQSYFDKQVEIENASYQLRFENAKGNKELEQALAKEHSQIMLDIETQRIVAEKQLQIERLGVISGIGNSLRELAGKNKTLASVAVGIEKAASVGQIIANTGIANAKATAASPLTGGQPWVSINSIAAGLSIAATIKSAANAIKEINGSGSGSGSSSPNYGKNYALGGMIGGKRHAQGGTIIEAEQGEAIINRNSVALFKPLLSMMNQMGGGVPLQNMTTTAIDNTASNEPQIIKAFVVESDLTSKQERVARLKDLSTI